MDAVKYAAKTLVKQDWALQYEPEKEPSYSLCADGHPHKLSRWLAQAKREATS